MIDFNKSGQTILNDWKNFRKDLNELNTYDKIVQTINFWGKAPLVNFVLNYYEYRSWPTPWELIYENFYDSVVLSYVMSQTLLLSDPNQIHEFRYIKPNEESDYTMILIVDNQYVLNYSYRSVIDISDITYTKCLIRLKYNNKKLEEIK